MCSEHLHKCIVGQGRRQWHPTPVLLPGKPHGWMSLVGCRLWGCKSRTWPGDFTFSFHFHALEKEMATHSSVLAWRIPRVREPGRQSSMGVTQSWTRLKWLSSSSQQQQIGYSFSSKEHLLISWLQSPCAVISEHMKIKSDTVSIVSTWVGTFNLHFPDYKKCVFFMQSLFTCLAHLSIGVLIFLPICKSSL